MKTIRIQRGFTLLELIVVVGIFAVMAAMAYGGLSVVLRTRSDVEQAMDKTAAVQKAFWIMRDDLQNLQPRSILDNDGQTAYALQSNGLERGISFTRGGWPNPLSLPRPTLKRVAYFYDDGKRTLVRRLWPVLDRAPRTQPQDTVMLEHVEDLRWRFLDGQGNWQDSWPTQAMLSVIAGTLPANRQQAMPPPPRAVELTMQLRGWGRLRWLFTAGLPQLPDNTPGSQTQTSATGSASGQ